MVVVQLGGDTARFGKRPVHRRPWPDAPPEIDEEPRSRAAGAADGFGGVNADLVEAALESHYGAVTVVELWRCYYDQATLTRLSGEQAADMAGRLRLARVQGVGDERLARMAAKGLTMSDRPRAGDEADVWLTFRSGGGAEAGGRVTPPRAATPQWPRAD